MDIISGVIVCVHIYNACVREERKSPYCVHILTNILRKCMNYLIPTVMS